VVKVAQAVAFDVVWVKEWGWVLAEAVKVVAVVIVGAESKCQSLLPRLLTPAVIIVVRRFYAPFNRIFKSMKNALPLPAKWAVVVRPMVAAERYMRPMTFLIRPITPQLKKPLLIMLVLPPASKFVNCAR
jgi:hypothetical protein